VHHLLTRPASRQPFAALFAALFTIGAVGACSADHAPGSKSARAETSAKTDDSAAGTVDLGGAPYTAEAVTAPGTVTGTISLTGAPRMDTVPVTVDQPVCGQSAAGPVSATAKGLSNSVVWIADITKGKALPESRRIDLSSEDCGLDPRVQAAVVGTTVNVTNADRLLHKLIFTPIGTHDTLTMMPFFNTGQVVPSERLAKVPGIVEVTCVMHPWTRAYIAVFDHPYYAVTDDDGKFTIDSLPPGSYKMMVWHEGAAQPVEQQIQVAPNGSAKVDVALTIK
jgi:hypothetical protein